MPSIRFLRLSALLFLGVVVSMSGQESVTPAPCPVKRSVRISFLPPPLDGRISLGVYDAKGKLVRVLHREAEINEFTIGTDALSTMWDGKNDEGENVSPGKYTAHGFAVGDLEIKSIGFFFNDFVTNANSPRVRHLGKLRFQDNELHLEADLVGDARATLVCEPTQGTFLRQIPFDGVSHCDENLSSLNGMEVIDCHPGPNGTLWLVDSPEGSTHREIKQLSQSREVLHQLVIAESEPQPQAIAAPVTENRIFLVEETSDKSVNRLRALTLGESKSSNGNSDVPNLKTDFEKKIIEHRNFSLESGKPIPSNPKGKIPLEKISVRLQPNPLLGDARVTVDLAVGLEERGSFLRTSDGLPLRRISETPKLIRSLLGARGANSLDVFQDDSAVVEQFRLTGLDRMMSFDCGGFELK